MASIKLPSVPEVKVEQPVVVPIEETVVVSEVTPPVVEEEEEPQSTLILADAFPNKRERPRQFYIASHWHITPDVPGKINATNNVTGDKYIGTMADFNDMLRGD